MIIKSAEFVTSSVKLSQCPNTNLPEFAFIGRSNVGKSSFINLLTNNNKLSKTSSTPGKTLLINHFLINNSFYIVDLPGYGYAKISKTEREKLEIMISNYIIKRHSLSRLFILIDARHEPMNIDLIFIENIIDINVPFDIIMTKCDKVSKNVYNKNANILKGKIFDIEPNLHYNIIFSSTVDKMGVDQVLDIISENLNIAEE
ncbi:MAG: ribosome biogenesis GTP-binding protein YihA/YsxC [Bacteroidales bacterium]